MVDNRGPVLVAVCSTFVSMAFVATILRMYVRIRIVRAFGWDDVWMLAAMCTYIMFTTCAIGGVHWGTGRHMDELDGVHKYRAMRYWWLCYIAYCITMISVKISVGIFLLRIIVRPLQRWIIYIAITLSVFAGLAFFFVTLFQCTPVSYFWARFTGETGRCVDNGVIIGLTYLYSGIAAISDGTFGVLPIVLVRSLNMSRNSKFVLIPILSMACVASLAVVVRMPFVLEFRSNDFLYQTIDIAIWSDIEQGLAITAGSLGTLRPLYRMISAHLGLSGSATSPKASGEISQQWYRTPSSKPVRSGPLSMISLTRTERARSDRGSGEYTLGNLRPIPIGESDDKPHNKAFTTWRIEVGNSKENLHESSNHGISRQTAV